VTALRNSHTRRIVPWIRICSGVADKRKIKYDFFTAVPGGDWLRRRASDTPKSMMRTYVVYLVPERHSRQNPRFFS
jgi:hypothetical protein